MLCIKVKAQDTLKVETARKESVTISKDTTKWIKNEKINLTKNQLNTKPAFKPNPTKAVLYSAIFPGLGQIYNRKYWKLPLVYGGLLGLTYGISWNGQYYNDYKSAYSGIIAEDPFAENNFNKWKDMAPLKYRLNPNGITDSDIQWLKTQFKRKKDVYRRNRDLCIIGIVGVYALCMIDAYVDAHLFDFDISPDLSLSVQPTVMEPLSSNNKSVGVQCSVRF